MAMHMADAAVMIVGPFLILGIRRPMKSAGRAMSRISIILIGARAARVTPITVAINQLSSNSRYFA